MIKERDATKIKKYVENEDYENLCKIIKKYNIIIDCRTIKNFADWIYKFDYDIIVFMKQVRGKKKHNKELNITELYKIFKNEWKYFLKWFIPLYLKGFYKPLLGFDKIYYVDNSKKNYIIKNKKTNRGL